MKNKIIDGTKISQKIYQDIKTEAYLLNKKHAITPCLVAVLVGDNPASHVYVRMKEKRAKELGFISKKIFLDSTITTQKLLDVIAQLNNDNSVHGILVQLPLPNHIDSFKVIESINPKKDVDCFHPQNIGKLLIGEKQNFYPCTPFGVIKLLEYSNIETTGKNIVILGRSNIVGKPMFALLSQQGRFADATVTLCHSKTKNIKEFTQKADIIIAAVGKANFLTEDMVKDDVVIIDVGINRVNDFTQERGYSLVGDVDFKNIFHKAALMTPVPGGVGPMTIAILMQNTLRAAKLLAYDTLL